MRALVRMASLVALVVFVPSLAFAQASITGVVRDSSGAVLPGVTVEAASPALIEKVRSTATESNGQNRIENLRPGTYTITFTLPGFATVLREGLELAGSFTATINADLRVGGVEETVTVTGESPIVDVQSTLRQRVMNHEVIDAIPSARSDRALALLVPGVSVGLGNQDVGGTMDQRTATMSVHGSRGNDQRIMQNGVSIGITAAGGANSLNSPNMSAYQEVQVETAAVSAELASGGVRVNFVPKDGGNTFSGTMFATFANGSFVGNNFTDELKAAGLGTPDGLKKVWDYNPGFGGPIRRDKIWFNYSFRHWGSTKTKTDSYFDANPSPFVYTPDFTRPGLDDGHIVSNAIRVSW
ncbi:MAG: carboxypeptidase regulatory-like domain-containing protein, partial [Gammaproteobacteria bacterium]